MAPIFSTVGITPQIIDDGRLGTMRNLLETVLLKVPLNYTDCASEEITMPLDIERIVTLLEPWQSWTFEEQVIIYFCTNITIILILILERDGLSMYQQKISPRSHIFNLCRSIFKNGLRF